jgi:hypothetical protein
MSCGMMFIRPMTETRVSIDLDNILRVIVYSIGKQFFLSAAWGGGGESVLMDGE